MRWLMGAAPAALGVAILLNFFCPAAHANGAAFLESYLDPSNPKVVFAVFDSASPGGVYLLQSYDGGQTWAKVAGPDGSAVRKYGQQDVTDFFVRVGPKPNARLIITYSAVDKLWRAGPDLRWQTFAAPKDFIFDQLVSPPHPDRFFAIVRKSEEAESRSSTLFRTETGGASWVRVRDSLPFTCDILVNICEIRTSSDGKVLIGEGFVSRDGGTTWKDIAPDDQVQTVAAIEAIGLRTWPIEGTVAQVAVALRFLSKSMEAGQLSKQLMPEAKVTREETSPKGERSTGPNAQFIEALKELETALLAKIDSDVETTARAFWDAYDIQRSRRVADFVLAPLTIIEQTIGTVSFAKNIPEIFAGIESAENILQVVSLFMGLSQLNQVGQNLQVAMDGPAYSSLLKAMLTEAAASTQRGEYATTIKLHLYGIGGKKSPVGVLHRPLDGGGPKAEVLWGAEAVKRRISDDIAGLIRELEAKPVGAGAQVEAIRTHLSTLTQALKRARADNVAIASSAVLPAADSSPDLLLGSIGALEQVRREALTQYDSDLRLEQISVLTSAVKAGTQVISLKVGYKTPGGNLLKEVQREVITPGALLVNTLTKTYATSARYQVAALPHEMVLSLPGELTNSWELVEDAVDSIRNVMRTGASVGAPPSGQVTSPLSSQSSVSDDDKLYSANKTFEEIVQDTSISLETKLARIDDMRRKGFDLNNPGTKHGFSPMQALISYGTADLATALLRRGLNVDSSVRGCHDQYWYTQDGLLRSSGLEVLDVLVKAGFNDRCLKTGKNAFEHGIVCGVMMGSATQDYNVPSAVRAVEFLAVRGFDVNAKCFGETIPKRIEAEKDPVVRQRLAPVANAVRKYAAQKSEAERWKEGTGEYQIVFGVMAPGTGEVLYETTEIPLLCDKTGFGFGFTIRHISEKEVLFAASIVNADTNRKVLRFPDTGYKSTKMHDPFPYIRLVSDSSFVGNWRLEIFVWKGREGEKLVDSINYRVREATEADRRDLGWSDSKRYYEGRTVEEWECGLRDKMPEAQKRAFDLLAQSGPRSIPIILSAWDDKNAQYEALARKVFERIGPPAREDIPRFVQILQDPKMAIAARLAAVSALGDLVPAAKEAVLPALTEASKEQGKVGSLSKQVLRRIKFPSAPPGPCKGEFLDDFDAGGWAAMFAMQSGTLRPCPQEGDEEKKAAANQLNVAFTRKHGVRESVACEALSRNPFAYEGKVVALNVTFEQMIARDRGLFGCGVAVSGIPQGVFSSREVEVVLAGRVLGNTEVKIGPATLQVPHLQYVGVHICNEGDCADFFGPASMR